ncbi:ArsR/SmtB family transcription factor [Streptococcus caprae]|uniref:ArsR/SmtB family transcription factor n=1 Tax=Streptococcus caprae TaxID=1640501 RepID=A0ABV8CTB9_9STRE
MKEFKCLAEDAKYIYSVDIDALISAFSVISVKQEDITTRDFYSVEQWSVWKKKYRLVFETFHCVKDFTGAFLLNFLVNMINESLTLEMYEKTILSLSKEERVWQIGEWSGLSSVEIETIKKAMTDDFSLQELYEKVEEYCTSYLGFVSFVRDSDKYINEFMSLAKELRNRKVEDFKSFQPKLFVEFKHFLEDRLKVTDVLTLSEELMGKSFRNRGPYEVTYFVPTVSMPFQALRLFDENGTKDAKQILFYQLKSDEQTPKQIVENLRVLSDETRYRILTLLSQRGPLKGNEIVKALNLAPSTISHHMVSLKQSGLVMEEPVKTAKYYSLSKKNIARLFKKLSKDLSLDDN